MNYLSLARKWRPSKFSDVIGHNKILEPLIKGLDRGKTPAFILFTGTRGVGKTTLARILATSINCEQGVSAKPCQACSFCHTIREGSCPDVIEIDAASRTKVEDTRETLEQVAYLPQMAAKKIYIIDEVHMLSSHSFNALLKTLEEPPEHVVFIMATTESHKLPMTILSRAIKFHLPYLSTSDIATRLAFVFQEENIQAPQEVIDLIAQSAQGSMRDALSLADQAILLGNAELDKTQIEQMLGMADKLVLEHLALNLVGGTLEKSFALWGELRASGANCYWVLDELLTNLHEMCLWESLEASRSSLVFRIWQEGNHRFSQQSLQTIYQILLLTKKDLVHAPSPEKAIDIALIRVHHFVPTSSLADHRQVQQTSSDLTNLKPPEIEKQKPPEPKNHQEQESAQQLASPLPPTNEPLQVEGKAESEQQQGQLKRESQNMLRDSRESGNPVLIDSGQGVEGHQARMTAYGRIATPPSEARNDTRLDFELRNSLEIDAAALQQKWAEIVYGIDHSTLQSSLSFSRLEQKTHQEFELQVMDVFLQSIQNHQQELLLLLKQQLGATQLIIRAGASEKDAAPKTFYEHSQDTLLQAKKQEIQANPSLKTLLEESQGKLELFYKGKKL